VIVITDEQTADRISLPPNRRGYIINVASNKNGVGYGAFTHIDGFSSHVLDWIREDEELTNERMDNLS